MMLNITQNDQGNKTTKTLVTERQQKDVKLLKSDQIWHRK